MQRMGTETKTREKIIVQRLETIKYVAKKMIEEKIFKIALYQMKSKANKKFALYFFSKLHLRKNLPNFKY